MRKTLTLVKAAAVSAALVAATLAPQAAHALVFSAIYWEVPDGTDPDFGSFDGHSPPNLTSVGDLVGGQPTGTGVNDVNGMGQITWWSHTLNPNVMFTGTGTITTPYANFAMFPPNSMGSSDSSDFETAKFTTTFSNVGGQTLHVSIASDDDSLVYLNGIYIGGDLGIKPIGAPVNLTGTTAAGLNTLEVFYADRQNVAAALTLTVGIPEPSTWAMMALGFCLGFAGYRRAKKNPLIAA